MIKTPPPAPVVEEELHAFVDNALDADRRREIQDHLDRNPDAAATVAKLASQRQLLRSSLAHITEEPLPGQLRLSALIANRQRRNPWTWQMAAAILLALGTGAVSGWQLGTMGETGTGIQALAGEARSSYSAYVAEPLAEAGSSELVGLVSRKLKQPIAIPDLSQSGYQYIGGRLVATIHGLAGLFFFDRTDGTRMAVMVRPMATDREAPMVEQSTGAIGGVTWAQKGLGYSVVGTEAAERLHPIADEIRRQTQARPST